MECIGKLDRKIFSPNEIFSFFLEGGFEENRFFSIKIVQTGYKVTIKLFETVLAFEWLRMTERHSWWDNWFVWNEMNNKNILSGHRDFLWSFRLLNFDWKQGLMVISISVSHFFDNVSFSKVHKSVVDFKLNVVTRLWPVLAWPGQ